MNFLSFGGYDKGFYDNIKEYYCPENNDYYIASNINSPNFQSLTIYVSECNSTKHSYCKSPSEIEMFVRNNIVDLKIIYSYFDFENFENPVRTYLGDYDTYSLNQDTCKSVRYPIKYNQIDNDDNIFFGGGFLDNTSYYYSVGKASVQNENFYFCDQSMLMLEFYLDQESEIYQRSVFTLFDMIGLVGGIYTVFSILSSYLMSFITERLLMDSLLSKLYFVEQNHNQEINLDNNVHCNKQSSIIPKSTLRSFRGIGDQIQTPDEKEEDKSNIFLNQNVYPDSKSFDKLPQEPEHNKNERIETLSRTHSQEQSEVAKSIINKLK